MSFLEVFILAVGLLRPILSSSQLNLLPLNERLEIFHHLNIAAASYSGYPLANMVNQGLSYQSKPISHNILGFQPVVKDLRLFTDNSNKTFSVGMAGTDCVKDWINNMVMCYGQASILGLHNIQVHQGFFNEARTIYNTIKYDLVEKARLGYKICFDGHSRGGPVNAFSMAMFADDYPEYQHLCYLFTANSAPAAGPEFVNEFNKRFAGRAFNIYDEKDIVGSLGLFGTQIPGMQLPVGENDAVTGHPHKITNLMAKFILNHLQDSPDGTFRNLPNEDGFFEQLQNIRDLAPDSGDVEDFLQTLQNLASAQEGDAFLVVIPGMGQEVCPEAPKSNLYMVLNLATRNAFLGASAQFAEDLVILGIDGDLRNKRALKQAIKSAVEAGAATFASSIFTQEICSRIDYAGMSPEAITQVDRTVSGAANVAVGAVMRLAKGDHKGAMKSSIWGAISVAASHCAGYDISIGPAVKFCSKGLFGKISYLVIDSKMCVDVPVPQIPGMTIGVSVGSVITMEYEAKVHGMVILNQYKANCPIGGQVKFLRTLEVAVYYGNVKVCGAGTETLKNGDIVVVQFSRKVELGMITHARAGHRGNTWTVGIIRDVEWKRWDKFYKEPKNLKEAVPCRHLLGHKSVTGHGASANHEELMSKLLQQMGLFSNGRMQNEYGEGKDDKKVRKGLSIYRSGRKKDLIHQSFFESINKDVAYSKNKDGSETTSFLYCSQAGTDSICVVHGGERRILWVRYDRRSNSTNKLTETEIKQLSNMHVTLTTWPDGSFTFKANPVVGIKNGEKFNEKDGRWNYQYFLRERNISDTQIVRRYTEKDTGKIVDEAILPDKIAQDKVLCQADYKKGGYRYKWRGERNTGDAVIIKDELFHKWSKHLPEFKTIESFIRMVGDIECLLSSQIEGFEGFTNNLNRSADFAKYSTDGSYSTPIGPEIRTNLRNEEGKEIFNYDGVLLRKVLVTGADQLGKYKANGIMQENGNVAPTDNIVLTPEYLSNRRLLQITGPTGGAILVDMPASSVPSWLGGTITSPNSPNVRVTVLPFSQLNRYFAPIKDGVDALSPTINRELSHLVKDLVDPNPAEITKKDDKMPGRAIKERQFVYNSYYQLLLEPSGDITQDAEVTFKIVGNTDLEILSEIWRNYVNEDKDNLAIISLDDGGKLTGTFCQMASLSPATQAAVNGCLKGKSVLEASLSENIMTMKDGSTLQTQDAGVSGLVDIKETPEVLTKRQIVNVDVEFRENQTDALHVSFSQHTDNDGKEILTQSQPAPYHSRSVLGTGKEGAPIISNERPEKISAKFGGDELRAALKNDDMKNPQVTLAHYLLQESQFKDQELNTSRKISLFVEDVVNPKPEVVKHLDAERDRESNTVTYEYNSSQQLDFKMEKDLGEDQNTFTLEKHQSTGVVARSFASFNRPGKGYLDAEVLKHGEHISEDFGARADLDPEFKKKIQQDLDGHGEVEIQSSLLQKTTTFNDGSQRLDAFTNVFGRKDVVNQPAVKSAVNVAGFNLDSKVQSSSGQGYEYNQHKENDSEPKLSDQKDLGTITNTQTNINGQQIQEFMEQKPNGTVQVTVNGYQKNESNHENHPEKSNINRQLVAVVDNVKSSSKLIGLNFLKNRVSSSTTNEFISSTTLVFSAAKDLGDGNTDFSLARKEDNDKATVKEVRYGSMYGNSHLDSQDLKSGHQIRTNFGKNAELTEANRNEIAKDLGAIEGTASLNADLYRTTVTHKDGSTDRTVTTVVTAMTGLKQSSTELSSSYGGLLKKTQIDVTGKETEYRQQSTQHANAPSTPPADLTMLQIILNKVGLYSGSSRSPANPNPADGTFTKTVIEEVTLRTIHDQGLLIDSTEHQTYVDGQVPIDAKTGKQKAADIQESLSSCGSSLVGGVVSSADEYCQRTGKDCPKNLRLDTKAKKAEFIGKRCLSTALKGAQALLNNNRSIQCLVIKTTLHCVGKSCLDDMGRPKTPTRWEIAECTGSALGELALRIDGYPGMAYASYIVAPSVKFCKRLFGVDECKVGVLYCTKDRRTCPAGEDCPWDCSNDLIADSFVNSAVGGLSTFFLMKCVTFGASFCFGPVGAAVCAVATTAIAAPRFTRMANDQIRKKENIVLRSKADLEREREEAFEKYMKFLQRESLMNKLKILRDNHQVDVTIEELEGDKDPRVIMKRGKVRMLRLHPDRRVNETQEQLDKLKLTDEYLGLENKEKSSFLIKKKAELEKKQTEEQQDFTELLHEASELAERHLGLDIDKNEPAKPACLGVDKGPQRSSDDKQDKQGYKEVQEKPDESAFKSSFGYLRNIYKFAQKCTGSLSSFFLYRVYSADYYSRVLLKKYGVPLRRTMKDFLDHFNRVNSDFSESVCTDFISYCEACNHTDAFGLHTLEYVIMTQIQDIVTKRAHRDLKLANISRMLMAEQNNTINTLGTFNPKPDGFLAAHPLTIISSRSIHDLDIRWFLVDLLLLSPIPSSDLSPELKMLREHVKNGKREELESINHPYALTAFIKDSTTLKPNLGMNLSKVTPGLNQCCGISGEMPLTIQNGEYELWGYTQGQIVDTNDSRQWLQAPSLTIRSGGSFFRLDGSRAWQASLKPGSATVYVKNIDFALYLPSIKSKKIIPDLPGLVNFGATCYMNSLIQVFTHLPPVKQKLSVFGEFYSVMSHLSIKGSSAVDPNLLLRAFKIEGESLFVQQDVMEIFQKLLAVGELGINELFLGEWKHEGSSDIDPINVLSLPLNNTLIDALNLYMKTSELVIAPRIFAVHLHRSLIQDDTRLPYKDSNAMEFGEHFRINPATGPAVHYDLKAAIIHQGRFSASTGHYFALCKRDQLGWTAFNDEYVYADSIHNYYGGVDSESQAYMLFYVRRN